MRYQRPGNGTARASRPGFTLVEMLVVIAIIAVLISLSGAAIFKWIDIKSQDTTATTLRDVDKVLERQVKAVVDQANKETVPPSVLSMAGGDVKRARVIWIKLRLKQEFPMTFTEALNPWQAANPKYNLTPPTDLPGKRVYAALAKGSPSAADSSACLLLALSQNRGGVRLNPDELPSTALGDTNGDGLKEVIDSWGRPIAFFRWPTGNAELLGMNPSAAGKAAKFADPLDPDGLLLNPMWYNTIVNKKVVPNPLRLQFESLCHLISPPSAPGQIANYIRPTLVSAGIDGQFGLDAPMPPPPSPPLQPPLMPLTMHEDASGLALDNIYSYRLRMGARGGK